METVQISLRWIVMILALIAMGINVRDVWDALRGSGKAITGVRVALFLIFADIVGFQATYVLLGVPRAVHVHIVLDLAGLAIGIAAYLAARGAMAWEDKIAGKRRADR